MNTVYGFEVVKTENMENDPAFWNLDENDGYVFVLAKDNKKYKVFKTNETDDKKAADILADVRRDLTKLLDYLENNKDLWYNDPIAFGIYHTLYLHTDDFEYLEMRPNKYGIIGLNKPKEITTIKVDIGTKVINYELGTKRNIALTLRNSNGSFRKYKDIMDLAIHELTHTTCNDVRWIPESKGGNHRDPYGVYHRFMRNCAKQCKII